MPRCRKYEAVERAKKQITNAPCVPNLKVVDAPEAVNPCNQGN
jgi:hypothetical protein